METGEIYCKEVANEKLRVLGNLTLETAALYAYFEQRSAALLKEHEQKLGMVDAVYDATEASLINLMRQNKEVFFPEGCDQVDLPNGVLLHGHGFKVSIPRNAVESCEREGFLEAVKIAKSIDRAVIEAWEDVRLAAIGAKRLPVEKFEYELADLKAGSAKNKGKKKKKTKER